MEKVKLSGVNLKRIPVKEVFFTPRYYRVVSNKQTKDGGTYLELIITGKGARGFKHLLEKLYEADPNAKIIFTDEKTCKKNGDWFINLDNYKKSTQNDFMIFYRKTGLDAASKFLNATMPDLFTYKEVDILDISNKKSIDNLPNILSKVQTKKDIATTLEKASTIVDELGRKKNKNKPELERIEKLKYSSNIASIISGINELEERLDEKRRYKETSGPGNWQLWLKEHSWIFGVYYNEPFEKQRIGFNSIPDYLFPTLDGFIDLYEIKLPSCDVLKEDSSHPGSWLWSPDANRAIGQCVNYLSEIEVNQLQLKDMINNSYNTELSIIKPRAYVVIGSDSTMDTVFKKRALRKLNFSLHGIEVITYSDLKRRGEQMLKIYGYNESH